MLAHDSGLKGISGQSGDMRTLLASRTDGARLAVDVYVDGLVQGVAAMAACIGGVDALVYSGGIGTHSAEIRARVADGLTWMGLGIDPALTDAAAGDLASATSTASTFALSVDEEQEMMRSVAALEASVCTPL